MKVLFDKRIRKQVKVYYPYAEFSEVCTEPAILFLSGGTPFPVVFLGQFCLSSSALPAKEKIESSIQK